MVSDYDSLRCDTANQCLIQWIISLKIFTPLSYWESEFESVNPYGYNWDSLLSHSVVWIEIHFSVMWSVSARVSESLQSRLTYSLLFSYSWVNVWLSESFHSKLRFIPILFSESFQSQLRFISLLFCKSPFEPANRYGQDSDSHLRPTVNRYLSLWIISVTTEICSANKWMNQWIISVKRDSFLCESVFESVTPSGHDEDSHQLDNQVRVESVNRFSQDTGSLLSSSANQCFSQGIISVMSGMLIGKLLWYKRNETLGDVLLYGK